MPAADELRDDHAATRAKLTLLESWLPSFRIAPVTISRLTDDVAVCLRAHVEREHRVLVAWMRGQETLPLAFIQRLEDEHENQRTELAVLHGLLTEGEPAATAEDVMREARTLLSDVRAHLAREETLLPTLDQGGAMERRL